MAGCESAQLVESFHEEGVEKAAVQRQRAGPWRRVGLAAAVVATVGAAVGTTLRSKPVTPVQRLHKMRDSILKAFSTRALAEAADVTARIGFKWLEVGQEDPSAMSMEAVVETTDEKVDAMTLRLVFAAQEDKGEDLVAQFGKVISGIKDYIELAQGEGAGDMVDSIVSIKADEAYGAVITVLLPLNQEEDEAEKELASALKTPPKFTASLSTGRSIEDMFKHLEDNVAVLPGGIVGHIDAAFYHTLMTAAAEGMDEAGMGGTVEGMAPKLMSPIASYDMKYEFSYRPESGFDELPNFKAAVGMFSAQLASGPPGILEPIAGLADFADGLNSIELTGLPHNYRVLVTFKNCHITPILKNIIVPSDGEEEDGEEEKGEDRRKLQPGGSGSGGGGR